MLTPEEVAEKLRVHEQTVRKLLRDGELEGVRVNPRTWRIRESALERFLMKRTPHPSDQ